MPYNGEQCLAILGVLDKNVLLERRWLDTKLVFQLIPSPDDS